MKATAFGTGLFLAALGVLAPAQEPAPGAVGARPARVAALEQRVAALRGATTSGEVIGAWWELERFVAGASDLPAALRTDALGAGLAVDPPILQVRVIKALAAAPDGARAALHLLEACRRHEPRERKLAEERWRPELDPQEARILGYEVSDTALALGEATNRAQALEVVALREELLAACRSNPAPDATRGLVILLRCLAPEPAVEPVFAALLERRDEVVPEGVVALFEAAEAPRAKLRDAVKEVRARKPRPLPQGERRSKWEASEKKVGKLLVAHREWLVDQFEQRLDATAARVAAYTKDAGLPAPPVHGLPLASWQQWREAAEKAIAARAGR